MLYGFIKLLEPEAQVTKYVLLHWQGEASPNSRRAVSASHLLHVKGLLKGASMEISATNEDDIDEEKIQEKLRKIVSTIGFTKAVKEIPSPVEEKPKSFVASPVRSPIKIPTPAPLSPPPVKVVEKPKSPQKIVSPFLNPVAPVASEPQKAQNGSNGSSNGGDSGPSHVNKIRAMFSQQKQEEANGTNGDSMTKKQPPAKPVRNSIARKMEEQKAIFEKSMLEPVVKSNKQDDILREIQAAKQQAAKEEESTPEPVQNQTYQKENDEQKLEEERCIKELEQQAAAPTHDDEMTANHDQVPNESGKDLILCLKTV